MSIKGILFDFDGVVVKSMEQHFAAWQKAFAEKGVTITKDEFFILEGQGIYTISSLIGKQHGLSEEDINYVRDRKLNYYNQFMTIEFYDYFPEMLSGLAQKKIPMGIVTGGVRQRVTKIVDQYFNGEFSAIVTVDDVKRGKPFPDPFLKGAEKLQLAPKECVVVENAPMGIRAAVDAGMTVIALTSTLPEEKLRQAQYIAHDFKEVERLLHRLLDIR